MFNKFFERQRAKSDPRYSAFVEGKSLYTSYLADYPVSPARHGPDDYQRAVVDSRLDRAEACYREAIDGARVDNRSDDVATGLMQLGMLLHLRGDFEHAAPCFEGAISIFTDMGRLNRADTDTLSSCHFHLGIMAYKQGDAAGGRTQLERSITVDEKNNNKAAANETRQVIAFLEAEAAS